MCHINNIHKHYLQQKMCLVRVKICHYKLIDDGQKGLRNQKLNIAKGNAPKSKGDVVTFKVHHE